MPLSPSSSIRNSGFKLISQKKTVSQIALEAAGPQFFDFIMSSGVGNEARACIWMTVAMALHFGGYEFARSANLTLFTSPKTGFTSPAAFPLAMALVSPFSLLLLLGYNKELEESGPKVALRRSTAGSILVIGLSYLLFQVLQKYPGLLFPSTKIPLSKVLVGIAFVFQNSYAHLLYTQQWSFLGSVMTPQQGSRYFAQIAGLSSLASTFTGAVVGSLVQKVGLYGLLASTCVTLTLSMLSAERAYKISEDHGFDPAQEMKRKQEEKAEKQQKADKKSENKSLPLKAIDLFRRVPTLRALFFEVLSFQSLSTILNVSFVTKLKSAILDDQERASFTGKFYSSINAASATAQFVLLPLFMRKLEPKFVWRLMPVVPFLGTLLASFQKDPSLLVLAFAFWSAKCMDYSARGISNELVYLPLDFESRYVGKEVIGVFANRFGKSGMSLLLSGVAFVAGEFGVTELCRLSSIASVGWASTTWWLSSLIKSKEEAQKVVLERKQKKKKQQQQQQHRKDK